jgi:hypothetical protein
MDNEARKQLFRDLFKKSKYLPEYGKEGLFWNEEKQMLIKPGKYHKPDNFDPSKRRAKIVDPKNKENK